MKRARIRVNGVEIVDPGYPHKLVDVIEYATGKQEPRFPVPSVYVSPINFNPFGVVIPMFQHSLVFPDGGSRWYVVPEYKP